MNNKKYTFSVNCGYSDHNSELIVSPYFRKETTKEIIILKLYELIEKLKVFSMLLIVSTCVTVTLHPVEFIELVKIYLK